MLMHAGFRWRAVYSCLITPSWYLTLRMFLWISGSNRHSASHPLYPMLMAEECAVLEGVSQPMEDVQTERSYVTYSGESTQLARLSTINVMRPARSRPTPRRRLFINRYQLSPHGDEVVLYSSRRPVATTTIRNSATTASGMFLQPPVLLTRSANLLHCSPRKLFLVTSLN